MVDVECPFCGHKWNYKGKLRYATCANCLNKAEVQVKVEK